eukprot:c8977_g3_i1.p1 GENE.c8977_g3_i1~~c8977_g3_i1.p1  ORF type:complete len:209 (-),score=32.59 c8977_g3_i1:59-685(-)
MRFVCISDTHNHHRDIVVPDGDVLIHAGDFTNYGKEEHAVDFNAWLGELPHAHKVIVLGNHECNAPWAKKIANFITNAIVLQQSEICINGVRIFGTNFFWPCPTGNPYFSQIPEGIDIVIAHGPVKGYVDGNSGCPSLLEHITRIRPKFVISGHVHFARGVVQCPKLTTTFINCAMCGGNDSRVLAPTAAPITFDLLKSDHFDVPLVV